MRRVAPAWAHDLADRTAEAGYTGPLTLEYENGRVKKAFRGEWIAPPREASDLPDPDNIVLAAQYCPDDGSPMAELDYASKFQCSLCGGIWSYYDLRAMGKLKSA